MRSAIFFGTPDFCLPCLEVLKNHPEIKLTAIVSMPDRPAGRGKKLQTPPVAQFAHKHQIPCFQSENISNDPLFLDFIHKNPPDLFIVLAFAQFLSQKLLSLPKDGAFNIHTSLLPKYRGAAPIQYALLNGDLTTGASIQKMVKKMDAGDVASFNEIEISPQDDLASLTEKLKHLAAKTLTDFLKDYLSAQLKFTPQDEKGISFAPSIPKEMGHLNFKELSTNDLLNKIRALNPWPGTYTFWRDKRLKIFKINPLPTNSIPASLIKIDQGKLLVGGRENDFECLELQLEGKNKTTGKDFINSLSIGMRNNLGELK